MVQLRLGAWLVATFVLGGCGRAFFDALPTDGAVESDASVPGDPSAIRLTSKNLVGATGATVPISYEAPEDAELTLAFREIPSHRETVAVVMPGDKVTLPAVAGVYELELVDRVSGGHSYGRATVSAPVMGYTALPALDLSAYGPFGNAWPITPLAAGDIDGDGAPDLVASSGVSGFGSVVNEGIRILSWDGSGLTSSGSIDVTGRAVCDVALVDHDVDDDLDLVVVSHVPADGSRELCIHLNAGNGVFAPETCVTDAGNDTERYLCSAGLAVADFDYDGRSDYLIGGGVTMTGAVVQADLTIYRNTTSGLVVAARWLQPASNQIEAIAVTDVNDDGRLDVIANGGEPIAVRTFLAQDSFDLSTPMELTPPHGTYSYDQLAVGYLDDDHRPDLLVTHTNGPSSVIYSGGAGPGVIPTFNEQHGAGFHILDLDADGELDVVIPYKNRELSTNRLGAMRKPATQLLNPIVPGPGTSILGGSTTTGWALTNFVFSDWNRDGRLDAVYLAAEILRIEVLLAN